MAEAHLSSVLFEVTLSRRARAKPLEKMYAYLSVFCICHLLLINQI